MKKRKAPTKKTLNASLDLTSPELAQLSKKFRPAKLFVKIQGKSFFSPPTRIAVKIGKRPVREIPFIIDGTGTPKVSKKSIGK